MTNSPAASFVIRSMSTTDYTPAYRTAHGVIPAQQPVPYHVYLLKAEKRRGAFWSRGVFGDTATFATAEEAREEIERHELTSCDVVPYEHSHLPAYWEAR